MRKAGNYERQVISYHSWELSCLKHIIFQSESLKKKIKSHSSDRWLNHTPNPNTRVRAILGSPLWSTNKQARVLEQEIIGTVFNFGLSEIERIVPGICWSHCSVLLELYSQRQFGNEAVVALHGKYRPRTQGPSPPGQGYFLTFLEALFMMMSPLFVTFQCALFYNHCHTNNGRRSANVIHHFLLWNL